MKPLVNLIWVAGFVFVVGALVAMWPDAVEQRRLAARYAAARARGSDVTGARPRRRCSRSPPSSSSRGRSCASPAPASDRLDELAPEARQRLELAEERDRALAALKELEFDHRTGKVSDEDYRAQVGPLRRRAAEALRALGGRGTSPP